MDVKSFAYFINICMYLCSEDYYKQVDLKQLKKAGYWTTPKYTANETDACNAKIRPWCMWNKINKI